MLKRVKARKGAAFIMVIGTVLIISVLSAISLRMLGNTITQMHAYSLQMRSYYLNHAAEEAAVEALLSDDRDLLNNRVALMPLMSKITDSMIHKDETGAYLGKSNITVSREIHKYYEKDKDWAVITVNTEIPDDEDQTSTFTYKGSVMMLIENPIIQIYDIEPAKF